MAYYVFRPSPETIAKASREFILAVGAKTQDAINRAKLRVEDAYRQVEASAGSDDVCGLSRMVGEAEEALAEAAAAHLPNIGKMAWENRGAWKEEIETTPLAMPQLSQDDWASFFTPRQNKPQGY